MSVNELRKMSDIKNANIKRRYNNYIMNINNKQQHIYFELLVKLTERRGGTYENIRR